MCMHCVFMHAYVMGRGESVHVMFIPDEMK